MTRTMELGLLLKVDPEAAAARILEAYRKTDGYVPEAASMLGVGARSLVRWTTDLELRAEVDKIREAAGRRPSTTYAGSNGLTEREGGVWYGSYRDADGKRIIRSTKTKSKEQAARTLAGWASNVRRSQRPQRLASRALASLHRAKTPKKSLRSV